ncbi:MAG: segregation/condensation protein A [Patescibacteria group bacterium]
MFDHRFTLEQFEGPLDLLLKLIEDEKLDVTSISLAKVTDQYLNFIRDEGQLPPDEVADFLVVASKLIYIKSRYLLPTLPLPDEDEGELERQLKIYREYYEASKVIHRMLGRKHFAFVRAHPLKLPRLQGFSPPQHVTLAVMADAFRAVIGRLEYIAQLPRFILKKTVSIREKIQALTEAISRGVLTFHSFYDISNKQDVIVSFLALLELVKLRVVHVKQSSIFSDIVIMKRHSRS